MSAATTHKRSSPERLAWMAAIVVGASLPHWLEMPIWIPALLAACIGWRFAAAHAAWPLPGRTLRLVLAFCAFSAVLVQFGTVNGVTAGSALLIVMVALKFLEAEAQRDELVLMIIAYFLAFASLLYRSSVLAGGYLFVFVWITTIALVQLGRGGRFLPAGATAKLAGRLLIKAVPVMLVLFVLFPRLPGPLWAIPDDTVGASTGLSDSMSPGDITALGLSEEVAFRAEFFGTRPARESMYWRGHVLAAFDGRAWSETRRMRRRGEETLTHVGERADYRVTLEPGHERLAFAIDMPERWDAGRHRIVMTSDYELRLLAPEARGERLAYEVTSYADYRAREPLSADERAELQRLPEGYNPRTRALASQWRAAGLSAEAIVERALALFTEEEFFYTLTPPPLGRHTADEFLFETREGFCEHFASAFAVLMRAAGIPTRVVTGYQGGELNRLGDYYIVRQSDAHAWTEIWLEDAGWLRVDPTATVAGERISLGAAGAAAAGAGGRGGGFARNWARDLSLAWDAVNMVWDRWVLGYGPRLQRTLLELIGFERPGARELIALAVAALAVLAVAFVAASGLARRSRRPRDPAARAFERFVAKLSRVAVAPRGPSESPTAYGERAKRSLPAAAGRIDAIVRSYLRTRYEPGADARDLKLLEQAVRDFEPT